MIRIIPSKSINLGISTIDNTNNNKTTKGPDIQNSQEKRTQITSFNNFNSNNKNQSKSVAHSMQVASIIQTNSRKTLKHRPNRRKIFPNNAIAVGNLEENTNDNQTSTLPLDVTSAMSQLRSKLSMNKNDSDSENDLKKNTNSRKTITVRGSNKNIKNNSNDSSSEEEIIIRRKKNKKSTQVKKVSSDSDSDDKNTKKKLDESDNESNDSDNERETSTMKPNSFYKILSNTTTKGKPKIIKDLSIEKEDNGISVTFDIDVDSLELPCYTINYKTSREFMLGTISKVDRKQTITKFIQQSKLFGDEITFGIVDIYSDKDSTIWIQKLIVSLNKN
jgi:hypothetical protein